MAELTKEQVEMGISDIISGKTLSQIEDLKKEYKNKEAEADRLDAAILSIKDVAGQASAKEKLEFARYSLMEQRKALNDIVIKYNEAANEIPLYKAPRATGLGAVPGVVIVGGVAVSLLAIAYIIGQLRDMWLAYQGKDVQSGGFLVDTRKIIDSVGGVIEKSTSAMTVLGIFGAVGIGLYLLSKINFGKKTDERSLTLFKEPELKTVSGEVL